MNFISIDAHRALAEIEDPHCGLALKRNTAADLVAALIDFLDDLEPDLDAEAGTWPESNIARVLDKGSDENLEDGADAEVVNEDGGDINDLPHDGDLDEREGDPAEDMEYSAGIDCAVAATTQWTPERPVEEAVWSTEYTNPAARISARRQRLRQAAQEGHQGHFHGMVLNRLPERYRMTVEGQCMAPEINHGDCLEFSTTEKPRAGDFVAIYRWARHVGPGEWQIVVKRFLTDWRGDLTPVVMVKGKPVDLGRCIEVEMLNPRKRLYYAADHIEAIHKLVRIVPQSERSGGQVGPAELLQ